MSTDHALQVGSSKDLHGGSLYPDLPEMPAKSDRLYPDLSDLNEIKPIETPIAGVVIKVGEEGAPQTEPSTPYKQAKSSSWGLPSLSSWMGSSKKVKERIQWGKDDYPTKKEFTAAAALYYGPRIITYDPSTTSKALLDRSQLDHDSAHTAYMKVFNHLSTVFSNQVSSLPLGETITEYNGAIDKASAPFETINKQRQVARDLRGFFLGHLVEDEGSKISTTEELEQLMREHLVPFAATG